MTTNNTEALRDFDSWWGASKYCQVIFSDDARRQVAMDAWIAALASQPQGAVAGGDAITLWIDTWGPRLPMTALVALSAIVPVPADRLEPPLTRCGAVEKDLWPDNPAPGPRAPKFPCTLPPSHEGPHKRSSEYGLVELREPTEIPKPKFDAWWEKPNG